MTQILLEMRPPPIIASSPSIPIFTLSVLI
jgi:hypothetical protein